MHFMCIYVLMPGYWSEKYNSGPVVLGFADLLEGNDKLSCFCFSEAKCIDVSPGFLSDPAWLQFFLVFQCASGLLFLLSCLWLERASAAQHGVGACVVFM